MRTLSVSRIKSLLQANCIGRERRKGEREGREGRRKEGDNQDQLIPGPVGSRPQKISGQILAKSLRHVTFSFQAGSRHVATKKFSCIPCQPPTCLPLFKKKKNMSLKALAEVPKLPLIGQA